MKHIYFFLILVSFFNLPAQNTLGVLRNDTGSFNGYTLFTPFTSRETYLINNCGQVVNQWSSNHLPGISVYLLENGNLLRAAKIDNDDIQFGGVGGKIELFSWDGDLLWEYIYSSSEVTQHHDIFPLPNGNILMLAATTMTQSQAIQAGRDPSKITEGKIYNEQILELQPVGTNQATIVWEWNINDHLIQDFDATKDNFGVVGSNPQLLDFNYLNGSSGGANWLHANSMQYNAALDQIVLSTRILDEIYIIDHSTTTAEAASHSGGTYGKGGDFLYRWGNVEAYRHGTSSDKVLFGQHYPHWIPDGLTDAGKIMIFNNGGSRLFSSIDIIDPPVSSPGIYDFPVAGYGPAVAEWSYVHPAPSDFFSAILSSGQRLPNGNTLICDGDSGYFFEIDTNDTIVWEYANPVSTSGILAQGATPIFNFVFRAHKFPVDYAAFDGKDLTPGNPIEREFDINFCEILAIDAFDISDQLIVFPNPASDIVTIRTNLSVDKVEIYNVFGKLLKTEIKTKRIDMQFLASGIYFAKIYSDTKIGVKKIIKQ